MSYKEEHNSNLAFLHIPKAGGTSIANFIEKFFCIGDISTLLSGQDLHRVPITEIRGARFLRSHAIREAYRYAGPTFRTLSFVRDPVERTVSHFQHLMHLVRHIPGYEAFAGMDLKSFLSSDAGRAEVTNLQTGLYSLDGAAGPRLVSAANVRRDEMVERFSDRARLDEALSFIDELDHVGTVENWLDTARGLCEAMKWPLPQKAELHRSNQTALPPSPLPDHQRREIEALTQLDLELYEIIRDKERAASKDMEARLEQVEADYKADISRRKSHYYWNFEQPFYASGIYQRESAVAIDGFGREDHGVAVAGRRNYSYWASDDLTFDVWLEPGGAYRLRCYVDFIAGFAWEKVVLSINDTVFGPQSWRSVIGNEMLVDLELPAEALTATGFARIGLRCIGAAIQPPGDDRRLALHLQWIEIIAKDD
jgi:hypothetical protein